MSSALLTTSLFLKGLLAGVFLCSALVEHAERSLDAAGWVAYKQAKERVFGPIMPVFFGVTLLATIFATALSPSMSGVVVILLLAATLVITVAVHIPLNNSFQTWTPTTISPGWDRDRRRWRDWNWVRCVLAVCAFAISLY